MCDGKDLRLERLTDRKQELRRLLNRAPASSRLCYVDHIEGGGIALFKQVCRTDLEGVVAKYKHAPYLNDLEQSTWFKIRNPKYSKYSQWQGREQLFERDRHREPVPGWHSCELACERFS
jgi:ATP-dependent DNA ligase